MLGDNLWGMLGEHFKMSKSFTECSANYTNWISISANLWQIVPNDKMFSATAWRLIQQKDF